MKNILCYGDSNTFGFTLHGGRHPYDVRWSRATAAGPWPGVPGH